MSASKVVVFVLLVRVISQNPNCLDRKEVFIAQPSDVVVKCGSDESVEFKCQHTLGSKVQPVWIINSTVYGHGDMDFPDHYVDGTHNGTLLTVKTIAPKQNNTIYQCQLEVYHLKTPCTYKSTTGRLILRECAAPDIQCSAHYDYKTPLLATLKGISTNITKEASSHYASYVITYSDFTSDEICDSVVIPASTCADGVCSHTIMFNISSKKSRCSKSSNMSVTVTVKGTKGRTIFTSEPQIIDSVNHFIKISFEKVTSSISLKFINQPKASKKYYLIKYGIRTLAGCKDLSLHMEGYLSNSNLLSLELNLNLEEVPEVCFSVVVNNGTRTVIVEGTYKTVSMDSNDDSTSPVQLHAFSIALTTMSICGGLIITFVLVIAYLIYCRQIIIKAAESESKILYSEYKTSCNTLYGEFDVKFDREKMSEQAVKELKQIDKSTTYFGLHIVTKKCLMEKFARYIYPSYQPTKGFGHYELDMSVGVLDPAWDVILMNEKNEPKFSALGSAIKINDPSRSWKSVYVQSKSVSTELNAGTNFLYCACSELVTAYWVEYDVPENCKESEFVKDNITGYQTEWIPYGYFEFKKQAYIKPHQEVIVKKKTGKLMMGAGVCHLVGATGDGSQLIQPPNLSEHPEWERVFVQSRDLDRTLLSGSKYLFCAMMDRVRETVHFEIYDVYKSCNMAVFAKHHIPGFKPERGYGYYECKQEEYLEPEKKVVLVDKHNRLFTGAGARFFRTGGGYNSDDIRKKKYLPPSLDGTPWKHIFIQSHSDKRELQASSKFLYFEY